MNEQTAFSKLFTQIPNMLLTRKVSLGNWSQILLILAKVGSYQNIPSAYLGILWDKLHAKYK